jgi:AcrR family transcriptional regulator
MDETTTAQEETRPRPRRGRPLTAAKRNAILAGARAVFGEKPFEEVLVDEVARRAGVGKGTLYRYFSSKEDLYVGMVVAGLGELQSRVNDALAKAEGPVEKLRALARETLAHFWSHKLFHALINREEGVREKSQPFWEKERDVLRAHLARILEEGVAAGRFRKTEPVRSAIYFYGLIRAGNLNRRDGETPESLANEVVDLYVAGIGSR